MRAAAILFAALVATGLVLWLLDRRAKSRAARREADSDLSQAGDEAEAASGTVSAESTGDGGEGEVCCGMHITCERDSLLSAVSDTVEYYDDEELDRYRGRDADSYTDAETEEFRDVLITLLPDDIAGWARSIQLRGITLPTPVRDELLMIVAEERTRRTGPAS